MTISVDQWIFDAAVSHLTTEASAEEIYLGPTVYDKVVGCDMWLEVIVTTAFTDSSSNSTMTVTLETKNAGGSYATALTLGTFAALSAAGTRLIARIPEGVLTKSYAQLKYTVANGDLTTGAFAAQIKFSNPVTKDYAVAQ